ncbi:MAG: ABC-2 transporter permease [bacterium]|nr:ABC-2 transporter permease [bacterium]
MTEIRNLLVRDLIVLRFYMLIGIPLAVLFLFPFADEPLPHFFGGVALTTLLALTACILDDKYQTHGFFCCLPVSRARQVWCRYLSSLIAIVIGLLVVMGQGLVIDKINGGPGLTYFHSGGNCLIFVIIPLVMISLFYPIYYRIGVGAAMIAVWMIVITFMVGIIDSASIRLILNRAPAVDAGQDVGRAPGMALIEGFSQLANDFGEMRIISITGLVVLGVLSLSALLSTHILVKREF